MLEALASHRSSADGSIESGDIIVLALPGHPWGMMERKSFVIVEWDSLDMLHRLLARQKTGETWPVISHPYAVIEKHKLVKRSTHGIDLKSIPEHAKGKVVSSRYYLHRGHVRVATTLFRWFRSIRK